MCNHHFIMQILGDAILVHIYLVVQKYCEKCKPQASRFYVDQSVSQSRHFRLYYSGLQTP